MEQRRDTLIWVGLTVASVLLAVEPFKWLFNSWHDPSYQSYGALYGVALLGLIAFSLASSRVSVPTQTGRVYVLLAASLRLSGQLLAVNFHTALASTPKQKAIQGFRIVAVASLVGLRRRLQ